MERFKGQKYEKLRKHHADMGVPWSDPTFPATDTSIGHSKSSNFPRNVKWLRPSEICDNPRLFVDGISHHDATQGHLGNCWFVAACSVLSGGKEMWTKVIPDAEEQEFSSENYGGIFRFRFWRFGEWIEVCVDDLLPCSEDGDLLFTHSSQHTEFWSALLEKAYAKLHGCYAVLDGGNLSDALVDFTSGVSEVIDLNTIISQLRGDPDAKKAFFNTMEKELEDHALMCCAIQTSGAEEIEKRTDLGLVKGHAYGITAVTKVDLNDAKFFAKIFKEKKHLYLVRLQNPWGRKEWTGAFSDKSPEWAGVSQKEKEKLGLTLKDDGEFWMPFDDFLTQFSEMSICRLINTSLFSFNKTWNESQLFGSWIKGEGNYNRAGGCLNNHELFLKNPQYRISIETKSDEETKDVIIQLSQRDSRSLLMDNKETLIIGFTLLKVEFNRKYRLHQFSEEQIVNKSDYIKSKHIFLRANLPRGRYVIVVTTFEPGQSTDFLLRVFTEEDPDLKCLTKDVPTLKWYQFWQSPPKIVTRLTVKSASGLEKRDIFGKGDPYCHVKCEGQSVETSAVKNTQNPEWNESFLFYRRDPKENHMKLSLWNKNLTIDGFIGQALVKSLDPFENRIVLEMKGRRSKKEEIVPGTVKVTIENFENLEEI